MNMANIMQAIGMIAVIYMIIKFVSFLINGYAVSNAYTSLELQMLIASIALNQYKYHAIRILEITYAEDPAKMEEFKKIEKAILDKFDAYGDSFIKSLMGYLPYKTEYNNWQTALQYMERLIKDSKSNK